MLSISFTKSAPVSKLVDAASVNSLLRILAVFILLQFTVGVYYYVAYSESQKTNVTTTAMLEKALETNGQLMASNNALKANLAVAEVKLSKALIPESNFSDAFQAHVATPVAEKTARTVSMTKETFNNAYNYVFK